MRWRCCICVSTSSRWILALHDVHDVDGGVDTFERVNRHVHLFGEVTQATAHGVIVEVVPVAAAQGHAEQLRVRGLVEVGAATGVAARLGPAEGVHVGGRVAGDVARAGHRLDDGRRGHHLDSSDRPHAAVGHHVAPAADHRVAEVDGGAPAARAGSSGRCGRGAPGCGLGSCGCVAMLRAHGGPRLCGVHLEGRGRFQRLRLSPSQRFDFFGASASSFCSRVRMASRRTPGTVSPVRFRNSSRTARSASLKRIGVGAVRGIVTKVCTGLYRLSTPKRNKGRSRVAPTPVVTTLQRQHHAHTPRPRRSRK